MAKTNKRDLIGGQYDDNRVGVPYTGWKCAVCFDHAHVKMIDVTVVLIDGQRLTDLMIDYGVGVSPRTSYEIKSLDTDYFGESSIAE